MSTMPSTNTAFIEAVRHGASFRRRYPLTSEARMVGLASPTRVFETFAFGAPTPPSCFNRNNRTLRLTEGIRAPHFVPSGFPYRAVEEFGLVFISLPRPDVMTGGAPPAIDLTCCRRVRRQKGFSTTASLPVVTMNHRYIILTESLTPDCWRQGFPR